MRLARANAGRVACAMVRLAKRTTPLPSSLDCPRNRFFSVREGCAGTNRGSGRPSGPWRREETKVNPNRGLPSTTIRVEDPTRRPRHRASRENVLPSHVRLEFQARETARLWRTMQE